MYQDIALPTSQSICLTLYPSTNQPTSKSIDVPTYLSANVYIRLVYRRSLDLSTPRINALSICKPTNALKNEGSRLRSDGAEPIYQPIDLSMYQFTIWPGYLYYEPNDNSATARRAIDLSIYHSIYLSINRPIRKSIIVSIIYQFNNLPVSMGLSIYRPINQSVYRSANLSIYHTNNLSIYQSPDQSLYRPTHVWIYKSYHRATGLKKKSR